MATMVRDRCRRMIRRSGPAGGHRRPDSAAGGRAGGWRCGWHGGRAAAPRAQHPRLRHGGAPRGAPRRCRLLADTGNVSGADRIPLTMGTVRPWCTPEQQRIAQSAGGQLQQRRHPGQTGPGFVAGEDNTAAMQRLLGGELIRVTETDARFLEGDRRVRIHGLVVDGLRADLGPKAELSSGRWPADNTEIVVTAAGVEKGMPESGNVSVSVAGQLRDIEVVGTATALSSYGGQADSWCPPFEIADMYGSTWILKRDRPVLWAEVRTLNGYGIAVESAAVLRDPPDERARPEHPGTGGLRGQPGRGDRPRRRGHALHRHHPAGRPGVRRDRRAPAPHAWPLRRATAPRPGSCASRCSPRPWCSGLRRLSAEQSSARLASGPRWRSGVPPTPARSSAASACRGSRWRSSSRARSSAPSRPPSSRRCTRPARHRRRHARPERLAPANRVLPVVGALMVAGGGLFLVYSVKNNGRDYAIAGGAIALVLGALLTVPALLAWPEHSPPVCRWHRAWPRATPPATAHGRRRPSPPSSRAWRP